MAGRIRGYFVNAADATAETIEFEDEVSEYHRLLGCDLFDIATRYIEGHEFLFFVDDVGLLREDPRVTAIDEEGHPALVGNLVVVARDRDDPAEVRSLTDEELGVLRRHTGLYSIHSGPDGGDPYVVSAIDSIEYFQME